MTNDDPVKGHAGGHGTPMYVCVCMYERGLLHAAPGGGGGSLFGGFEGAGAPCSVCSPVAAEEEEEEEEGEERCLRRQG